MPKVMPEYKGEVRKKIIRAAIEASDEIGISNVKMVDIANKIGVSRATLYLYFKNREELIAEAYKAFRGDISEILIKAFEKEGFEDTFSAIFDDFIYPEHGFGTKSVIEMFAGAIRDVQMKGVVRDNYSRMREMITEVIENQKEKGNIAENVDSVLVAEIIQSITLGIKMGSVVGLEREEAKKIWNSTISKIIFRKN